MTYGVIGGCLMWRAVPTERTRVIRRYWCDTETDGCTNRQTDRRTCGPHSLIALYARPNHDDVVIRLRHHELVSPYLTQTTHRDESGTVGIGAAYFTANSHGNLQRYCTNYPVKILARDSPLLCSPRLPQVRTSFLDSTCGSLSSSITCRTRWHYSPTFLSANSFCTV